MPLGKYDFSERYGWIRDKYGVSWQVIPESMEQLMQKPDTYKTMAERRKIVIAKY